MFMEINVKSDHKILIFSVLAASLISACGAQRSKTVAKLKSNLKNVSPDREGEVEKPDCDLESIKTIELPMAHGREDFTRKFNYKYQFIENGRDLPTIVHIPGGPGDTYLTKTKKIEGLIAFNHILIDPRGVGCNHNTDIPDALLSTNEHATDIMRIIESLNLQNYILYGISYGTVVATVMGEKFSELTEVPKPKAILLEGVVGKAFEQGEYGGEFKKGWGNTLSNVDGLFEIFSDNSNLPYGYTNVEWWSLIKTTLSAFGGLSIQIFSALKNEDPRAEKLFEEFTSSDTPNYLGRNRFYDWVACREIFPAKNSLQGFWNGDFTDIDLQDFVDTYDSIESVDDLPGTCLNVELSTPYDSAEYQVRSIPLYYLQGENDPNTSLEQAKYHHAQQHSTDKYFIEVEKSGHNPSLFFSNTCKTAIFGTMLKKQDISVLLNEQGYCNGTVAVEDLIPSILNNIKNSD